MIRRAEISARIAELCSARAELFEFFCARLRIFLSRAANNSARARKYFCARAAEKDAHARSRGAADPLRLRRASWRSLARAPFHPRCGPFGSPHSIERPRAAAAALEGFEPPAGDGDGGGGDDGASAPPRVRFLKPHDDDEAAVIASSVAALGARQTLACRVVGATPAGMHLAKSASFSDDLRHSDRLSLWRASTASFKRVRGWKTGVSEAGRGLLLTHSQRTHYYLPN